MRHQVRNSAYAASGSCVRGHSELLCPRTWILLVFLLILSFTAPAYANCTSPTGVEGDIVYNAANNVPEVCTGSAWMAMGALNPAAGGSGCSNPAGVEGDIIYNGTFHILQYCDGDDWQAASGAGAAAATGCAAPTSCSNVGDVCSDGSIFAGFMFYGDTCKHVFVTDNNQSTSTQWKTTTGTDDINPDDHVDGQANHTN